MRLLAKSRKKYHRSIIKNHRSIIKDNTKYAKSQFKRFKYRKESKEYCPKISPMFGHSLPALWAMSAQYWGYGCPCNGHRQTNRRA